MSSIRTQSQLCTATQISLFVQCPISFWLFHIYIYIYIIYIYLFFQSKIKDIDEEVFNKIESLDKENDIKLSIKSCYQESCENGENKSRDLWIKSLEKLKNTYDEEMKKDKDHFLKFESEEDQGNRSESNNRHNRNSKNGYHHNQRGRGRYRHYSRRDYHNRQQK